MTGFGVDMDQEPQDIPAIVSAARDAFNSGRTKDVEFRRSMLKALLRFYDENKQQILEVVYKDLKKSPFEVTVTEVTYLLVDCKSALSHLDEWTKPTNVKRSLATLLDRPFVYPEPYGVVLVMGAWNYPLQLPLAPVAGAIAAGNCVIIKPSEVASATSAFLAETLPRYLDRQCYPVVAGGVEVCQELLRHPLDYIFYTGSTEVGRLVREASNKHLTPVTLELGGKSPVYLDDTADMNIAVRRILWGKIINAGQTCIAPDYLLCSPRTEVRFVQIAAEVLTEWFGGKPEESSALGRIINAKHFHRIQKLLESSGTVAIGGSSIAKDLYIEPTVLVGVRPEDPIMKEEIFGPVLPIMTVSSAAEAIELINSRAKPLAFYIFTRSSDVRDKLLKHVPAGGVCVNDTLLHFSVEELPFGGVGASGMGCYHGKFTFDTFTHYKSVLQRSFNPIVEKLCSVRYPPYTDASMQRAKALMKNPRFPSLASLKYLLVFSVGFLSAHLINLYGKKYGFQKNLPGFFR